MSDDPMDLFQWGGLTDHKGQSETSPRDEDDVAESENGEVSDYGLRYYQENACEAIAESLKVNRSCLIVMATGLGKTQVFCKVALEWPGRVLIIAHRSELIDQAAKRLESMSGGFARIGEQIGIEQGPLRSNSYCKYVVGTVQTCFRKSRLARMRAEGGFSLIIIDEAHHGVAKTYRDILDAYPEAKILGVTATPDRSDARAMGQVFEDDPFRFDIEDGIEAGYLVDVRGEEIFLDEVNLDQVSVNAGDFVAAQLDEQMAKAAVGGIEELVKRVPPWTRQGIIFTPGVHTAHYVAEILNNISPGSAIAIDGTTDPDERSIMLADFRAGRHQWFVNCQIATEGFDAPNVSVIGMMRPTKSHSMYVQQAGRGTRVLPGVVDGMDGPDMADDRRAAIELSAKPHCTIYDFVGNNTKHSLVGVADILGGRYTDEEKTRAKKIMKEEGQTNPKTALEQARDELRRAAKARAQTKARSKAFDPFAAISSYSEEEERAYQQQWSGPLASEAQVKLLIKYGFSKKDAEKMSKRGANKIISENVARCKKGLASLAQLKVLKKYGIFDTDIRQDRANAAMNYIVGKGYGRKGEVDPSVLMRLTQARPSGDDRE